MNKSKKCWKRKTKKKKQSELEKQQKLIQEEKAIEKAFTNEFNYFVKKYKVSMTITQPQIQITAL